MILTIDVSVWPAGGSRRCTELHAGSRSVAAKAPASHGCRR
jgi:hypothetical protein